MEEPIRALLAELQLLLSPLRFEPAAEPRAFAIAANNCFTPVVLPVRPVLCAPVAGDAPGVVLHVVPTAGRDARSGGGADGRGQGLRGDS